MTEHYPLMPQADLLKLLPKRNWPSIRLRAFNLHIHRCSNDRSKSMKTLYQEHPEKKAHLRDCGLKLAQSPHHHSGHSVGSYIPSAETRRKCSAGTKRALTERPELKAIACAALARGRAHMGLGKPPTKLERAVERLLKKVGADFNAQYQQNGFYLDFALPHEKVAILADGCFWHCCPVHYPMARYRSQQHTLTIDKKRDKALKKAGWQVLHILECEVNLPATLERIREVAQ